MASNPPKLLTPILSSQWHGLSPDLIARFYEVDKDGVIVKDKDGNQSGPIVRAPLTEANLDATLNWQSAFESTGPESKAPALFAMLQSGAIQPVVDALKANLLGNNIKKVGADIFGDNVITNSIGSAISATDPAIKSAQQKSSNFLKQFEGRTGITKLNSTQVFSGMPPLKLQVTVLLRAWEDAYTEVEQPLNQLMSWAFPQQLANDSVIANLIKAAQGEANPIEALLPSKSPKLIAMLYKQRKYAPMVIESIGVPLISPIDQYSNFVELQIPITLGSYTAWDKTDWENTWN